MRRPPLAALYRSLSGESVSAARVSLGIRLSYSLPIAGRLLFLWASDVG
jgi:hypothetical protein